MSLNLQPLVDRLLKEKCPTHLANPEITLTDDNIDVSACCDEFRETLLDKLDEGIEDALDEEINNF